MDPRAYANASVDLWNENIVNGEYIIAYELNPLLDYTIQDMLPEVRFGVRNLDTLF